MAATGGVTAGGTLRRTAGAWHLGARRGSLGAVVDHNGVPHDMDHLLAYIDPGSGSLLIQAVIATIVAIPFFFRQQIGRVVRAIRREDGKPSGRVTPPDGSS